MSRYARRCCRCYTRSTSPGRAWAGRPPDRTRRSPPPESSSLKLLLTSRAGWSVTVGCGRHRSTRCLRPAGDRRIRPERRHHYGRHPVYQRTFRATVPRPEAGGDHRRDRRSCVTRELGLLSAPTIGRVLRGRPPVAGARVMMLSTSDTTHATTSVVAEPFHRTHAEGRIRWLHHRERERGEQIDHQHGCRDHDDPSEPCAVIATRCGTRRRTRAFGVRPACRGASPDGAARAPGSAYRSARSRRVRLLRAAIHPASEQRYPDETQREQRAVAQNQLLG